MLTEGPHRLRASRYLEASKERASLVPLTLESDRAWLEYVHSPINCETLSAPLRKLGSSVMHILRRGAASGLQPTAEETMRVFTPGYAHSSVPQVGALPVSVEVTTNPSE